MDILKSGSSLLDAARRRAPNATAEAFLIESESRVSEWSEGQPENEEMAASHGASVRLIDQGRLGFAHTNRWDAEAFDICAGRAQAAAGFTPTDPFLGMPERAPQDSAALDLLDTTLEPSRWSERSAFLSTVEDTVKKRDKRLTKVLRARYSENRSRIGIVNSAGLSAAYEGTSVSFTLACVAVQDGETQIGYGFDAARHAGDLQRDAVIEKTIEGTLALLGGRQVPSGRYDLILDPMVAAEILGLFADALRGDQVLKGKSFFASRVGQAVGSPIVTIVDDGRRQRGLGSAPFDAEGSATQRTVLVQKGVLQGYLYDGYTARKAGTSSTGNAGRGSYKGVPEPDPSNFYLEPGTFAPQVLLAGVDSGLYVRNVMGLHTVDTISGDFSLGIMGERIEKGRRTHGVRGVTIAGNLLELLKSVEAAGSDLLFFGSIGSPTLRIKNISVGGL